MTNQLLILNSTHHKANKTFTKTDNSYDVSAYNNLFNFNFYTADIDNIETLAEALEFCSAVETMLIVRGQPATGLDLDQPHQRGHSQSIGTIQAQDCPWIMIDIDGIPDNGLTLDQQREYAVKQLPSCFQNVTYYYAWSSSATIKPGISIHLFFWINNPTSCKHIKHWMKEDVNEPYKAKHGHNLLDTSIYDPSHIHYVASPTFTNCADPLEYRTGFIDKASTSVTLPTITLPVAPEYDTRDLPSHAPASVVEGLLNIIKKGSKPNRDDFRNMSWAAMRSMDDPNKGVDAVNRVFGYKKRTFIKDWDAVNSPGIGYLINQAKRIDEPATRSLQSLMPQTVNDTEEEKAVALNDLSSITLRINNAECGAGKSTQTLADMAIQGGKYVYACDKILNIHARAADFDKEIATVLDRWSTHIVFKIDDRDVDPDEVSDTLPPVIEQISSSRAMLNKNKKVNCVIFITHAALKLMDWSTWDGWSLVIDEVPDINMVYKRRYSRNFVNIVENNLEEINRTGSDEKEVIELDLTDAGQQYLIEGERDDAIETIKPLLTHLNLPHGRAWCLAKDWDNKHESDMNFFWSLSPDGFQAFDDILLLGDSAEESAMVKVWEANFGVQAVDIKFKSKRLPRTKTLGERATVYYYTNSVSSSRSARSETKPIINMANDIRKRHPREDVLWTTNSGAKSKQVSEVLGEEHHITPKAHGRNDKQHYTICWWGAAMKASPVEAHVYSLFSNITSTEIATAREHNPCYQFIMRTSLRDWEADKPVIIYTWDKAQADYLGKRLGVKPVHLDGVIKETKPAGRPSINKTAMTNADRARRHRTKKRLENGYAPNPARRTVPKTTTRLRSAQTVQNALTSIRRIRG